MFLDTTGCESSCCIVRGLSGEKDQTGDFGSMTYGPSDQGPKHLGLDVGHILSICVCCLFFVVLIFWTDIILTVWCDVVKMEMMKLMLGLLLTSS